MAATATPFRFSTEDVPAASRVRAVRALREHEILPIEPLAGQLPEMDVVRWPLPGVGILSGSLCGVSQEGAPSGQGANDDLFFGINVTGRSTALQGNREATFGDGEAILLSCAEQRFCIPRPTAVRFVGVRVPRRRLGPFVPELDDRVMGVVPAANEPLRLLRGYLDALVDGTLLAQGDASALVVNHLIDLMALALGTTADTARTMSGPRAARLQAVKSMIAARLWDGDFKIDEVAQAQRVTQRYVQKLFEAEGTTFTHYLIEQRLAYAYRMLRDPRFDVRSISALAYDVGFNDLSYFNRAFRRRYNETPSEVRVSREPAERC